MTAGSVWTRLAATTRVVREMRSGSASVGSGVGTVITTTDGGAVVLTEAGTWTRDGAPPMRWRAVSRWWVEGDALAVEQVRQGEPASVILDPRENAWVGREPHACGADRYAVSLRLGPEAVEVTWTISGPHKAESVMTRYR